MLLQVLCITLLMGDGMKEALQLNESSQVLLYGTEGATDPEIYRTLVGRSADEVAATMPVANEDKSC